MRPFGLKSERFWDWEITIEDELGAVLWRDKLNIILSIIKVAGRAILRPRKATADRKEWRRRMKCCYRCPVYNKRRQRCRPFTGSVLGCGCYMPYAALLKETCWADDNMPEEHIGWKG